ncbi:5-dehydro-4-deoxyglucarate dehydratase (plasmid) [Falsihalocynthiibacter sp. SS001]|uniref:5-dehydro-4-deoxyglucarate dehydratase n=1 Tax=Falsihalocynthiibacter sp. SS001 TaxID=3349698 RepID=UPI0036D2DCCA
MSLDPANLKSRIGSGLLSFPVTDFKDGEFDQQSYAKRLEWLASYPAAGLFAAGGTGEFFSLGLDEYETVIETAVKGTAGKTPVIAGTGYGTRIACQLAEKAANAGADGLLVLPHYLTEAPNDGIEAHLSAICGSTDLGVIYYARANSRLGPDALERLAAKHENLIGYKDGTGDLQQMVSIVTALEDRFTYIGGLPTAEIFAQAYLDLGVTTYSSAVFNFVPELAITFYNAIRARDGATINKLLREFYVPLVALRDKKAGYAVSMIKAGAEIVGKPAGSVRTPLSDMTPEHRAELERLVQHAKTLVA